MNCFLCKGRYVDATSTFMTEIGHSIIVIRDVPSQVCTQCGEVSYSTEVARNIERIVDALKQGMTEFAVVHYSENAA